MKSQTENKCAKFTAAQLTEPSSFFKCSSSSWRKKVVKCDYIYIKIDTEHSETWIHTVLLVSQCDLHSLHSSFMTFYTPPPYLPPLSTNLCCHIPPIVLHSTFSFIHTLASVLQLLSGNVNSLFRARPSDSVYKSIPLSRPSLSCTVTLKRLPSFLRLFL